MKDERAVIDPSWWCLQADVAWGRVLLSIATMHEGAAVRPEIYLFLGDRYWRLARRHFVRGRRRSAQRLVRTAGLYFRPGRRTGASAVGGGFHETSNHWVETDAADRGAHPDGSASVKRLWVWPRISSGRSAHHHSLRCATSNGVSCRVWRRGADR
jgi:hypothetical protein